MILLLLFLACVLMLFFAFPQWPLVALLLAPLGVLPLTWLARFVLRRRRLKQEN